MARGFIKGVGGNMRMRMVQPGYDADNYSTPPNKVIFDSEDIGTLSVLYSGEYRMVRSGSSPITAKIASWSLGYIPLCMFQFRGAGLAYWETSQTINISSTYQKITVDTTGITVTLLPYGGGYTDVRYQAYRLPVT